MTLNSEILRKQLFVFIAMSKNVRRDNYESSLFLNQNTTFMFLNYACEH
jgi:hypothetical protein